jgi:hypothetical protein
MSSLETRIAAALKMPDVTSAALDTLITEVAAASAAADAELATTRKRALDPIASPDIHKAKAAVEIAEFASDRLKSLLPRLEQRLRQVSEQEAYAAWAAEFDALPPRHAAAAAQLRAIYCEFAPKLMDALLTAQDVDDEVRKVMAAKPVLLSQSNGDGRNLPTVELSARNLKTIAQGCSLMKDLKIPLWDSPSVLAWPPSQIPFAVQYVESMRFPAGPSPDWHEQIAERNAARAEDSKRMANFYQRQTQEREERDKAEAKAEREKRQRQREVSR